MYGFQITLLFTHAARSAFLGAVPAILAILASVAGVGTCAGRCGSARWNLANEKNRQQDLSQNY
jgi:bacterioferritin-associated ferredoxin